MFEDRFGAALAQLEFQRQVEDRILSKMAELQQLRFADADHGETLEVTADLSA